MRLLREMKVCVPPNNTLFTPAKHRDTAQLWWSHCGERQTRPWVATGSSTSHCGLVSFSHPLCPLCPVVPAELRWNGCIRAFIWTADGVFICDHTQIILQVEILHQLDVPNSGFPPSYWSACCPLDAVTEENYSPATNSAEYLRSNVSLSTTLLCPFSLCCTPDLHYSGRKGFGSSWFLMFLMKQLPE